MLEVLIGDQLRRLSDIKKRTLGQQVSDELINHRDTMLQYDLEAVRQIIEDGRAVLAVDTFQDKMHGFAQISPWCDSFGRVLATEFRTWLSVSPGAGLRVLRGAVDLNRIKYPNISMYAVIEESNERAQLVVVKANGREVPMPGSMKVELKAGDQPAPVKTFDLTNIKFIGS